MDKLKKLWSHKWFNLLVATILLFIGIDWVIVPLLNFPSDITFYLGVIVLITSFWFYLRNVFGDFLIKK